MNLDNLTWLLLGVSAVIGVFVAVVVWFVVDTITRIR